MNDKQTMIGEGRVYEPYLGILTVVLIIASILTIFFVAKCVSSPSIVSGLFGLSSFMLFVTVFIPILMGQKVSIKQGNITLFYRIRSPVTFRISESLHRIVLRHGKIESFVFKKGNMRAKVSPPGYKHGEELLAAILMVVQQEQMEVEYEKRGR